jgi:hypothetical protein
MPIRLLTNADGPQLVACINETYNFLRNQGVLPRQLENWTLATAVVWRNMGYVAYGWERPDVPGRIDAAAVGRTETLSHPNPAQWWTLAVAAVRAQTIPDIGKKHESAFIRATRLALSHANTAGLAGIHAVYPSNWNRLDNFIHTLNAAEFETLPNGYTRMWFPFPAGWMEYSTKWPGLTDDPATDLP